MFYSLSFFVFIFGLMIGSFLNCLIWRLHKKETIMGRSYCPKCKKQIVWYDNLPVLSFLILKGKCRQCGKAISWQYPLVELITGALFVVAFFGIQGREFMIYDLGFRNNSLISGSIINFFRDWYIIAIMTIVFIYDLRWYLILDIVTLPACVIVFLLNLALGVTWQNMLISGIIGGSFFLFQFLVSKGKWIGGGDVRLGLLMGIVLGWPLILVAIFIAYIIGSIVGVGLIALKKKAWGSQIPLGVFLSIATIITLFWGRALLDWYLNILI